MNRIRQLSQFWPSIAGLIVLSLVVFGKVLFSGDSRVLGNADTDLFLHFLSSRAFGFRELASGHLPLWNPFIYSGAPYLGAMQAALLYPPNAVFLFMPADHAINWSIALHTCLLGALVYGWANFRGLHPAAAFMSAVLTMFGGTHFLHIYAGHLSNICTMAWTPLVFLAIDGVFATAAPAQRRAKVGWCLAGILAVAMQIFAGHPQYLFYTAVASGVYSVLRLIGSPRPVSTGLWLLSIYPGGALLGGVQLFTGVQASGETIRNVPVPYEFASMFSFPPENLLTLLAPNFFGDMIHQPYWGRCYLWEMSLFAGVTGLVLAIYGARRGGERKLSASDSRRPKSGVESSPFKSSALDQRTIAIVMVMVLLLLAIGAHTPLFRLLYKFVPGFGKFRGISKFIFQASLFLSLLAGIGFDRLLRTRRVEPALIIAIAAGGFITGVIGLLVRGTDLTACMRWMLQTGESYLAPAATSNLHFILQATQSASNALLMASGTLLLLSAILAAVRSFPRAVYAVLALGIIEVLFFAQNSLDTFDAAKVLQPQVRGFLSEHPGDYRVLNLLNPDSAMAGGYRNLWGYAPDLIRRYGEFIAFTQGINPDQATPYVNFTHLDPLYAMLRLRFAFVPDQNGMRVVESPDPMPHVHLVRRYRVIEKRDAIFSVMRNEAFDPRSEVLLEREPDPKPSSVEAAGSTRVVAETTDWLEIEVDTAQPAILLITDVFTPSWRAVPLADSTQKSYELMPANYILRAVPLSAGHHHLRVEYRPRAFLLGRWISIVALAGYLTAIVWWFRAKM